MARNFKKDEKSQKFNNARNGKGCNFKERDHAANYRRGNKSSANDVSWYAKNPELLKSSASYSFNGPIGLPLDIKTKYPGYATVNNMVDSVPGLMALHTVPTVGISTDAHSPVNLAANNIYSYVRYQNSGAANYDQADLMLYLLAMDSLYSSWNWAQRLYKVIRTYSQTNRYMPEAYFKANNCNFSDFMTHIADFRAYLNKVAAAISSFCVPSYFSYFIRHAWLYSNIYKDNDSEKAQQYMFVPELFYKYDETGSKFGGRLIPVHFCSYSTDEMKFSDLVAKIDSMINAVAYSEDIGIMSGDILKAFGRESLFTLSPVGMDDTLLPIYNQEVLTQIHNIQMPPITSNFNYNVTQDPNTGFIVYNPTCTGSGVPSTVTYMINLKSSVPSPEEVMVASRLGTTWVNEGNTLTITNMGSEFIVHYDLIYFGRNASQQWELLKLNGLDNIEFIDGTSVPSTILAQISLISQFDWHPMMHLQHRAEVTGPVEFCGFLGDVDVYTFLSSSDLDKLNTTALLSEFNVPQLGTF